MTIIVSYSEIFKWDTCQRQWYYRFGLGLKPPEESDAMTTGTKGHTLLQTFYTALQEGYNLEQALSSTQSKAKKMLEEDKLDFGLVKAWTLVDNYIRSIRTPPQAALVENRFLFPASVLEEDPFLDDVQIGFTPDVVFERPGGLFDVEDAKFVQRAWPRIKIERFQQAKLYQIFLKRMGYNVSRSVVRFFNVTTGKISEQPYILEGEEEKILIEDFMGGVREVVKAKKKPEHTLQFARRTTNYTSCQYCAFSYVCGLQAQGKDATKTLKNEYVKNDYNYAT